MCIFLMQTKNGVKKACQRFPTIFSAIKNCLWLIRSILVRKRDQRFLIYLVRFLVYLSFVLLFIVRKRRAVLIDLFALFNVLLALKNSAKKTCCLIDMLALFF